jgi:hypothetical protein
MSRDFFRGKLLEMTKEEGENLPAGEDQILRGSKGIPGIRLPAHWRLVSRALSPLEIDGELASIKD